MITQVFATKRTMTQAWTKTGKRLAVTRLTVVNNAVIGQKKSQDENSIKLEMGYGTKKLKNMSKPLRSKMEKSGFSFGVAAMREVTVKSDETLKAGDILKVEEVLQIGDVVTVQGTTKGRGFAGVMKRHNFKGGPKTHGQSDRWRAPGSIGQRTTPGRVFKGKRMAGHYGVDVQTVAGLTVLYINPEMQEVWLSGCVPGSINGLVTISKTGKTKNMEIDQKASGIKVKEVTPEVVEASEPVVETTEPVTEGAAK